MTDDLATSSRDEATRSLMDELLRSGVPEIKLALGEVIDRENARPLPPRYARLLPATVLVVVLRADAADALSPVAADLQRELTDSCNRHGSLYDRRYRVELQRSEDPDAPLYSLAVHAGGDLDPPVTAGPPRDARSASAVAQRLPVAAADAASGAAQPSPAWDGGRWVLLVEGDGGEEKEVFRLGEPVFTVGRESDDTQVRPAIAISNAPQVSRRQLAFGWEERDEAPGFRVYNLGLNEVHIPGETIPGARVGRGALDLAAISAENTAWLPPGVPLRIGERGPTIRIEEVPLGPEDVRIDPDATVFD